ncbi:MAG: SgcJ/EcaC family oxidoreductase [Polyangiales bacterium]
MNDLPEADRQAIAALFDEMYRAWGAGDAARYAACFEPDVDYVAFDGTHIKGRVANERLHRQLFDSVLHDTRVEGSLSQLRLLTPDVALAHATGSVLFPWQRSLAQARGRLSLQTLVLVRREGRWLAAAFQNTRVKPMPAPESGSFAMRAFAAYASLRRALARV